MFCQPELLDEEVALFIRMAKEDFSPGEANNLILKYDNLRKAYKAGDIPLDDLAFQDLLYSIRCRSCKDSTGPSGYEGWLHAAVVQNTLDWCGLSRRDREGFSEFLESERKRYQERSAGDPKGTQEAFKTMESRKTDDDFLGYRAKKIIKSPEYLALFWSKMSSGFKADALTKSPANGCERCGSKSDVAKLKRCTRCKRAFYCDEHCQLADWKAKHKVQCKFFALLPPSN